MRLERGSVSTVHLTFVMCHHDSSVALSWYERSCLHVKLLIQTLDAKTRACDLFSNQVPIMRGGGGPFLQDCMILLVRNGLFL